LRKRRGPLALSKDDAMKMEQKKERRRERHEQMMAET
jgi:hypothetical protein